MNGTELGNSGGNNDNNVSINNNSNNNNSVTIGSGATVISGNTSGSGSIPLLATGAVAVSGCSGTIVGAASNSGLNSNPVSSSNVLGAVAAKITHAKTSPADGVSGLTALGSGTSIVTNNAVSNVGAIKMASVVGGGNIALSNPINATPLALNSSPVSNTGTTSIRAVGSGGQSTQVRVVMGNLMASSMIKQLEGGNPGRTQITAFTATSTRPGGTTTPITVTRSIAQTTYLPRTSNVTSNVSSIGGIGVGCVGPVAAGQRLISPIRATPASTMTAARSAAMSRNCTSPAATVISQASSTAWMTTNTTGQVQLIRAIPHQHRQRSNSCMVTVSGTVVTTTTMNLMQSNATMISASNLATTHQNATSPIAASLSASSAHTQHQHQQSQISAQQQQQQQTYVATVLPPRQHQATLVYSSNVTSAQHLTPSQQFITTTSGTSVTPRFAVATQLPSAVGSGLTTPRHIRPIPLGKSFSTAKLNTTNISIRTPNMPQLTPTMVTNVSSSGVIGSGGAATITGNSTRPASVGGVSGVSGSTTRIIQLQQQPGGTSPQIIGSGGRLAANVMLQPIIVNASGGSKFGIRQPGTTGNKGHPSLTITQLGISKLPSSVGASNNTLVHQTVNALTNVSTGISSANLNQSNLSVNASAGHNLMNVSQEITGTGQLVAGPSSSNTANTTVMPVGINARGAARSNIITGSIPPLKTASGITVGKVMTQSQLNASSLDNNVGVSGSCSGLTPTNVFIHHTSLPQRPHSASSNISNNTNSGIVVANTTAVNISMNINNAITSANGGLASASGSVGTGAFLQPGSTIYYESVPANSLQGSAGLLSIPATTTTNSAMSAQSVGNPLSISALPFAKPSTGGNSSNTTYTVMPPLGSGRTIGQLQIPGTNVSSQIHTVPIRFSQLQHGNMSTTTNDAMAIPQTLPQIIHTHNACGPEAGVPPIIIPPHSNIGGILETSNSQQQHSQHMLIPLQTPIKVAAAGSGISNTTVVSNFLRKRESDSLPFRAAKNLAPTLLSMASGGLTTTHSSLGSISNTFNLNSITSSAPFFTSDVLNKRERTYINMQDDSINAILSTRMQLDSPVSSDGSTTVSANSSPGIDMQIPDNNNIIIGRIQGTVPGSGMCPSSSSNMAEMHFNPINEHIITGSLVNSRNVVAAPHSLGVGVGMPSVQQYLNNGSSIEYIPRKTIKRITHDHNTATSLQSQKISLSLPPPISIVNNSACGLGIMMNSANMSTAINPTNTTMENGNVINNHSTSGATLHATTGKENTQPISYYLKRPRSCTLLADYKPAWKSPYNHFQRYSDVKPREERKNNIMDLANQENIRKRLAGWKVLHLRAQIQDLSDIEASNHNTLNKILKKLEGDGVPSEMDRVCDLLKGNLQRSKIIVDGLNDSQNQIMKVLDHKIHVTNIVDRCYSKRNFKKRDK